MLPTICPVPLPGGVGWAARLERIGLDVISTGADSDDPDAWGRAMEAFPHRPALARTDEPSALDALALAGCRVFVTGRDAPPGGYALDGADGAVVGVDGSTRDVEDVNMVALRVLDAAREGSASALWVAAGEGLDALPVDVVAAKLECLVDAARQARLWLSKEQFDRE